MSFTQCASLELGADMHFGHRAVQHFVYHYTYYNECRSAIAEVASLLQATEATSALEFVRNDQEFYKLLHISKELLTGLEAELRKAQLVALGEEIIASWKQDVEKEQERPSGTAKEFTEECLSSRARQVVKAFETTRNEGADQVRNAFIELSSLPEGADIEKCLAALAQEKWMARGTYVLALQYFHNKGSFEPETALMMMQFYDISHTWRQQQRPVTKALLLTAISAGVGNLVGGAFAGLMAATVASALGRESTNQLLARFLNLSIANKSNVAGYFLFKAEFRQYLATEFERVGEMKFRARYAVEGFERWMGGYGISE